MLSCHDVACKLALIDTFGAGDDFVVCRREIGCRSSAKIFLREICLSCTGRDWTQIERGNFLREMGNRMQIESKKKILRKVYRRVQAGVGCRLSVKIFSTWNMHVGISMKSSYKM